MDARQSARLLKVAIRVARADRIDFGKVRPATWQLIDAAGDQLDRDLAAIARQERRP